jgi:hypothetical protein
MEVIMDAVLIELLLTILCKVKERFGVLWLLKSHVAMVKILYGKSASANMEGLVQERFASFSRVTFTL